jgi:Pyridoxamine 5'-phosphate oxidase
MQNRGMLSWRELSSQEPVLAEACRALLYQYGVGLAFLATVRPDGGPRVHPMCPVIDDRGLFAFLIPSPKRDDLRRDPRYAMHSFPCEDNEDAIYLTGTAFSAQDHALRDEIGERFSRERDQTGPPPGFEEHELFEFKIDRCLHTVSTGHGDPSPTHHVWRSAPVRET